MSGNARRRRRLRSSAEQMYWDQLGPAERVAFTLGYTVGQGAPFPRPDHIDLLRRQLGAAAPAQRTEADLPQHPQRRRYGTDLEVVAAAARVAIAEGESPAYAVMKAVGSPSRAAASMLIARARKFGHDIPYVRQPRSQR